MRCRDAGCRRTIPPGRHVRLFYHPVSSNCQKVLIALYEKEMPFEACIVDMFDRKANADYRATVNPIGKIPCLISNEGEWIPESSIIIEYIDRFSNGHRLIPDDPTLARRTRFWDRFIDLYVNDAFSKVLQDRIRPDDGKDPFGVKQARARLSASYAVLDKHLQTNEWLNGDGFSMADCAATPSLHIGQRALATTGYPNLDAYYHRMASRAAFQRVWQENLPWRERINGDIASMRIAQGWSSDCPSDA